MVLILLKMADMVALNSRTAAELAGKAGQEPAAADGPGSNSRMEVRAGRASLEPSEMAVLSSPRAEDSGRMTALPVRGWCLTGIL